MRQLCECPKCKLLFGVELTKVYECPRCLTSFGVDLNNEARKEETKRRKVAYISGPYRAATTRRIQDNIMAAGEVALKYWKLGYAVICPQMNTALFDGECEDKVWLEGDIELMKRADIVVMMKGWTFSKGAAAEFELAAELQMEIVYEPGAEAVFAEEEA